MPKPRRIAVDLNLEGAQVTIEDVPGVGILALQLNPEELARLRGLANEAYYNAMGWDYIKVPAPRAEPGDCLPGTGLTVQRVTTPGDTTCIEFQGGNVLEIDHFRIIRVLRKAASAHVD